MKKGRYIRILLVIILLCGGLAACADDDGGNDGATGSISFDIAWPEATDNRPQALMSAVDCNALGIATIICNVYNGAETSANFLKGETWQCAAHSGTVMSVTAGSNRRVVVTAKNADGDAIYKGEISGVIVTAGQTVKAGTVSMVSLIPNQSLTAAIISPSDNSSYTTGQSITFTGTGTDEEDGDVLGSTFVWTSSRDGEIKTGQKSFSVSSLSVGTHIITLTVADSKGATASDAITIIVSAPQVPRITFNALPDTGQTESYTNTFGEDSDYIINPPSYTKLDDTGTALGDNAASWTMVRDNITGLIWQKETANEMRWESAVSYCDNLTLGGYSDWRLPTIMELSTLINAGTFDPAINTDFFPDTPSSYYWSSSTNALNTGNAWCVGFGGGDVNSLDKSGTNYVRAVRGGQ